MNLWKYYDGDLKYPDITKYSHEKEIAKANPKWAYQYAMDYGKFPEGEAVIAKSAKYSHRYANEVLNGPFKLGEPTIAKDYVFAYRYAYAIKGAFPLGEIAISKNIEYSQYYTQDILKKDFILNERE